MKKIFIISLVLLCLVGSFYLVYNFLLVDNENLKGSKEKDNTNEIKQIEPNTEKVSKIIGENIKSLSLDASENKLQYYNYSDKGFWTASFDGSGKKKMSNDDFDNLKNVFWNQQKSQALLEMNESYYFYSFGNKEKFIKRTKALNWINFNQRIIYSYEDYKTGKKTLNISMPDGSDWREIATLENDDIKISSIPGSARASFWLKPDAFNESNITIVPVGEGELEKVGDLKFGSDYLWSNDGNKFLRSSLRQKGSSDLILEACEVKTGKCANLNLPTLASKCVWSKNNQNVYCALPINITKNAIIPNDYYNNKIFTKDTFWKVEINGGKKENILNEKNLENEIDAANLLLSPNEDFLFFINRKDGGLFRLML